MLIDTNPYIKTYQQSNKKRTFRRVGWKHNLISILFFFKLHTYATGFLLSQAFKKKNEKSGSCLQIPQVFIMTIIRIMVKSELLDHVYTLNLDELNCLVLGGR